MKHPVIDLQNTLPNSILGLVLYYNQQAIGHLSRRNLINYHVHQSRLCCKRIRSLLRLARPALDKEVFSHYNGLYRDASKKLSHARDLTALAETIDSLLSKTSSPKLASFLNKEKKSLILKRRNLLKSTDFQNQKKVVSELFIEVESGLSKMNFKSSEINLLVKGLLKTYKKGGIFFELNLNLTDSHLMHEWRKQVKYTLYQLVVMSTLWPVVFEAFIEEFQSLSKLLGEYQDLTLLEVYLKEHRIKSEYHGEMATALRLITNKKKELANRSFLLGKKLYSMPQFKNLGGWFQNLINLQQLNE